MAGWVFWRETGIAVETSGMGGAPTAHGKRSCVSASFLENVGGEGAEALAEELAERVGGPRGSGGTAVRFELVDGFLGGEAGDGAENEDGAHDDGKAFEPVADAIAVGPGDHGLEFLAADSGRVEVVFVDAGGSGLKALGRGEAVWIALSERIESGCAEGAAAAVAGFNGIRTGGDVGVGDGFFNEADALFALANEHGRDGVEGGSDAIDEFVHAIEGFGHGGFVFGLAVEEAMNALGKSLGTFRDGLIGNERLGGREVCHAECSLKRR